MKEEISKAIREKGLLLEKEIYELIEGFDDAVAARDFLFTLEQVSGQKIITKPLLVKNISYVKKIINQLNGESKLNMENFCLRLGLCFEIEKMGETIIGAEPSNLGEKAKNKSNYQIFYADTKADKKIEVSDFTNCLRSRYQQLQRMLIQRPDLSRLVSIGKISSDRQQLDVIGMVKNKRMTKNKNLIITIEDLTGEIPLLVREDRKEVFSKADELRLDDVIAVKASGNRDMLFVQEIYFPDAFILEKKRFSEDISIAFLSDIHCGSKNHLGKSFQKFLNWINSEDETAKKIRYLFIVGDNVDGVGIFPGQESLLDLKSMEEQYALLASYLKKIPKHITIFMCPGQHDATRVAEPQPIIDKRYAPSLYDGIENLILVTNPALIKLFENEKEFKVLMYHGASIHDFINDIPELRIGKAHKNPAKAVKHMLKRRHLAPTHSSVPYIPNSEKDPLVISEVPDVFCTGEVHRLDVETYNGVLIITGSCWQNQTAYEEKVGNIPDPAKVPILNLKTREFKILDFTDEEEIKK